MSSIRETAERFLSHGICPVPMRFYKDAEGRLHKTATRKWKPWQQEPMSLATLHKTFGPKFTGALSIITGNYNPLNLCGLDIDDAALAAKLRPEFEGKTVTVDTRSGGLHIWIKSQEPCRGGNLIPGVADLAATGQLLIVPPSPGYLYRKAGLTGDGFPPVMQVGNALKFAYSVLRKHGFNPVDLEKPSADRLEYPDLIPAGAGRNQILVSEGGKLQRAGYPDHLIEAMLRGIYAHRMEHEPPIMDEEFKRMMGQITQWDREYASGDYSELGEHTTEPPPPTWLIHEFLFERYVTILYGYGGHGKSYASLWLMLCLLTGTPFLDLDTLKLDNVLWWDYETDLEGLKRRAFPLAHGMGLKTLPNGMHHYRGLKSIAHSVTDVERLINASGAQAVILDSMTRGLMADPKEVGAVVEAMDGLDRLPVPVILIDHQAGQQTDQRGGRDAYSSKEPMGARQKGFIARNVWQAERVDAGSGKTTMGGMLTRKKNNLNLQNGYSLAFTITGLTTGTEKLEPAGAGKNLHQRVYDTLQHQARPMTARDIHEFWHEATALGSIKNCLTDLVKQHTVNRERGGGQGDDPYVYSIA